MLDYLLDHIWRFQSVKFSCAKRGHPSNHLLLNPGFSVPVTKVAKPSAVRLWYILCLPLRIEKKFVPSFTFSSITNQS